MRSSKQKIITAVVLAVLVLPAIYLGVQLFAILNRPYRTETAVEYTMSDSVFANGYVVFDQTAVEGSGDLGYLVENGERVAAGTAVAEVYASTEQAQSRRQLEELETQLSLLEKSENTSGTDVDMLYRQQQNALYDLLDCIDMQAYDQVKEAGNQYLLAANKIQIMTGAVSNFDQAKQELQAQKDQAEAQLGQPETISAPVGGYFVASDSADLLSLTREQLEAIFRGKITNWKEVGGDDMKIVVYSRETSSGTYEFFKESVLENRNYMASILSMPATGAIIQSVKQTKGAIGYIGLAYLNQYVKPLAVSYDGGEHYAMPSVETAADGSYPIVRPLYYYYDSTKEAIVAPFISYALSPKGQMSVLNQGFVPVNQEQ